MLCLVNMNNEQMHAKNKGKGGGKNGNNTLAAMTMLLQGLSDGEEVMVMFMLMLLMLMLMLMLMLFVMMTIMMVVVVVVAAIARSALQFLQRMFLLLLRHSRECGGGQESRAVHVAIHTYGNSPALLSVNTITNLPRT